MMLLHLYSAPHTMTWRNLSDF